MRTNASPYRFVLCALCALVLWSAPAFSQRLERGLEVDTIHHSNAKERPNVPVEHAMHDWTHDHMLYPRFGPMNRLIALQKDPRAIQHWQEGFRKDYVRWRRGGGEREGHRSLHHNRTTMRPDWNISVGAGAIVGATSPAYNPVYPAKWTFDSNESLAGAAGDTGPCLNDYLVVPINALSGATLPPGPGQPNIIGLNNLYSGNAGVSGTGVCNGGTGARTTGIGTTDDGLSATTYFSYSVLGDDGLVQTSPVTSMDGNLIAFVEGSGFVTGAAHFHVLAWQAGQGNNAADRQDALTNAFPIGAGGAAFVTAPPVAGSGTATDLTLVSSDSLSSPYVEYSDDVAYVGDDAGNIYRIRNVFCPAWAPCGGAQPNLDPTWGTGGILTIGGTCTGMVSSITVDGASGNIFAGCSDGNLYAFDPSGTPVAGSPVALGDGSTVGGIVDAPILDVVNGWVYAETGSSSGIGGSTTGNPILAQASLDLTTVTVATLGPDPGTFNIHAPAFNDAYFTSATSTNWLLYEYSSDTGGGGEIVLYGITFGASVNHPMNAGVPANSLAFPTGRVEVSPLTEFMTTGGEDRLFAGAEGLAGGNIVSLRVDGGFPAGLEFSNTEGTGTSGIVADNVDSAVGQANSVYFGVEGTGTNQNSVVKLTQVDLL